MPAEATTIGLNELLDATAPPIGSVSGWTYSLRVSLVVGLGWMAVGAEMLVISLIFHLLQADWDLSEAQVGSLAGVVFGGMMVGALIFSSISDRYGRKPTMLLTLALASTFGVCAATAADFHSLLLWRALFGLGIGGFIPTMVAMSSECIPNKGRGRSITLQQVYFALGAMFASLLAWWVVPLAGWRLYMLLVAMPLLLTTAMVFTLHESPRYLLARGRRQEARAVLLSICKANKANPSVIPESHENLQEIAESESSPMQLLLPQYRTTSLLLWLNWFCISFVYYGLTFTLPTIYLKYGDKSRPATALAAAMLASAAMNDEDIYKGTALNSVATIPGVVLAAWLLETVGRRPTLCGLSICQAAAIAMLAMDITINSTFMLTVVASIAKAFSEGAFAAIFPYTSEVYPTTMRAMGLGAGNAMARIAGLATPIVGQMALGVMGPQAMILYCAVSILLAIGTWLLPIETKGRALTESCEEKHGEPQESDALLQKTKPNTSS